MPLNCLIILAVLRELAGASAASALRSRRLMNTGRVNSKKIEDGQMPSRSIQPLGPTPGMLAGRSGKKTRDSMALEGECQAKGPGDARPGPLTRGCSRQERPADLPGLRPPARPARTTRCRPFRPAPSGQPDPHRPAACDACCGTQARFRRGSSARRSRSPSIRADHHACP